jgi:hypothetical protein
MFCSVWLMCGSSLLLGNDPFEATTPPLLMPGESCSLPAFLPCTNQAFPVCPRVHSELHGVVTSSMGQVDQAGLPAANLLTPS